VSTHLQCGTAEGLKYTEGIARDSTLSVDNIFCSKHAIAQSCNYWDVSLSEEGLISTPVYHTYVYKDALLHDAGFGDDTRYAGGKPTPGFGNSWALKSSFYTNNVSREG
jgi:hypothetical protein